MIVVIDDIQNNIFHLEMALGKLFPTHIDTNIKICIECSKSYTPFVFFPFVDFVAAENKH